MVLLTMLCAVSYKVTEQLKYRGSETYGEVILE